MIKRLIFIFGYPAMLFVAIVGDFFLRLTGRD